MENSKTEKELRRALKYEEKKAKQREKRRLGPNAGTGAKGYDPENTNYVDCNNEEHGIKTSKEAREIVPSDQSWSKRRENVDAGWDANRDTYLKAFIRNLAFSKSEICSSCHISITNLAVRCNTCRNILCPECDWVFHSKRPFHYRELFEKLSSRPLLPSECVNSAEPVEEKAVPVPLTVPSHCANCEHKGTIELTAGSTCFFRLKDEDHIYSSSSSSDEDENQLGSSADEQ
ncbi:hypothetical protein OUZ56_023730 [Daphnia magna]|uniref:B box-type domain-containing protein n=1 Tax=Daphnia magna TaxID=35525 RepID=A0ABR0AZP3_9CRUS|nr:hypothetical protein OUZ56_023730 [Daphnia magna]